MSDIRRCNHPHPAAFLSLKKQRGLNKISKKIDSYPYFCMGRSHRLLTNTLFSTEQIAQRCVATAILKEKINLDRSSHLTSIARWPIFSDSWQQKSASPAWIPSPIPDRSSIACHASPSHLQIPVQSFLSASHTSVCFLRCVSGGRLLPHTLPKCAD